MIICQIMGNILRIGFFLLKSLSQPPSLNIMSTLKNDLIRILRSTVKGQDGMSSGSFHA